VVSVKVSRDHHTGAESKKVLLYNSKNGYNAEAFVEELFRVAWPELNNHVVPIRIPGFSQGWNAA
jgi:hypothetical protein